MYFLDIYTFGREKYHYQNMDGMNSFSPCAPAQSANVEWKNQCSCKERNDSGIKVAPCLALGATLIAPPK